MIFSGIQGIAIPQGAVVKISSGNTILWNAAPNYINVLPLAVNTDGTPYIGDNGEKGYRVGWRINSSNVEVQSSNNCMTGFIPIQPGQLMRVKNTKFKTGNGYFHWYNDKFAVISRWYENHNAGNSYNTTPNEKGIIEVTAPKNAAYVRFSTGTIDNTSIFTLDEEI